MAGRDYCGKRYSSAEELLVHLKTHTNLSTSDLAGAGPGAGDLGWPASSNAVLFEAPRVGHVEPFLDTWAACDALLETDNTAFEEGADLISDQWSQISNKSRKPKL